MKKFLTFSLIFVFSILLAFSSPISFAFADEPQSAQRTIFIVDSKWIANTSDGVFVYDNSDKCLKQLNSTSSLSKQYIVGDCVDMCSFENKIYLLSSTGLVVFDTSTKQTETFAVDNLNEHHTNISVGKFGDDEIICIFPSDTSKGNIFYAKYGSNMQFFSIQVEQNQLNETTNISLLKVVEYNEQAYLIWAFDQSITSFPVNNFDGNLSLVTAHTLRPASLVSSDDNIVDICAIYANEKSFLNVVYAKTSTIYQFLGDTIELENSISHIHGDAVFVCKDVSVHENSVALLSDNCYYLFAFTNDNTPENKYSLELETFMQNPISSVIYREADEFEYYKLTSQSNLILTLGENSTTTLVQDSLVVEIADVFLQNDERLVGYKYIMHTSINPETGAMSNAFGYLETSDDCLEKLEQTSTDLSVKLFDNSKLFKFPSVVAKEENDQNCVIKNVNAKVPVKILCYISDYCQSFGQITTNYALAKVGDTVGFIDTKSIVSADLRIILVIPNAKLLAAAVVYENSDDQSTVLHQLNKDTKIKVLEGRNSDGMMKIAYNDSEGNYFEGYINAQNVQTDSYSTIQIIGLVLVFFNIAFLIVLILTKKRVAK